MLHHIAANITTFRHGGFYGCFRCCNVEEPSPDLKMAGSNNHFVMSIYLFTKDAKCKKNDFKKYALPSFYTIFRGYFIGIKVNQTVQIKDY